MTPRRTAKTSPGPVLVIPKQSVYERFAMDRCDARFLARLEEGSDLVRHVLPSHACHHATLDAVVTLLGRLAVPFDVNHRPTRRQVARARMVLTVGGDGTLLDAAHWVGATPVLGVNSNPSRSVGHFCALTAADLDPKLPAVLAGEVQPFPVARMELNLNGRRLPDRPLNDVLFAHRCPAAISDYVLAHAGVEEWQKSSGVWFATAAGSTGAIKAAGGLVRPLREQSLQYLVREPFRADGDAYRLSGGLFTDSIGLTSRVFDGAAFVDGHRLQHRMGFGDRLEIRLADEPLMLFHF
jgi:NAD+ kinase